MIAVIAKCGGEWVGHFVAEDIGDICEMLDQQLDPNQCYVQGTSTFGFFPTGERLPEDSDEVQTISFNEKLWSEIRKEDLEKNKWLPLVPSGFIWTLGGKFDLTRIGKTDVSVEDFEEILAHEEAIRMTNPALVLSDEEEAEFSV